MTLSENQKEALNVVLMLRERNAALEAVRDAAEKHRGLKIGTTAYAESAYDLDKALLACPKAKP